MTLRRMSATEFFDTFDLTTNELTAYLERSDNPMTTISVDYENNAEEWWDAARAAPDIPAELAPLLEVGGPDAITVPTARARALLAWARNLPGWSTDSTWARHPLIESTP